MDADDLVDVLRGITFKGKKLPADIDESELNLPAVWVRPTGLVQANIAGEWTEQVQLRLLVGKDVKRARKVLREMFAALLAADVSPDGPVQYATVTRPSTNQPVPALVFPLDLLP